VIWEINIPRSKHWHEHKERANLTLMEKSQHRKSKSRINSNVCSILFDIHETLAETTINKLTRPTWYDLPQYALSFSRRLSNLWKFCRTVDSSMHIALLPTSYNSSLAQPTNSMPQSPWKVNTHSASQEMPCLLRNLKFNYWVHKRHPLVFVLSQMNPVHTVTSITYFFNIRLIYTFIYVCVS
jgi:hypothetical protein